MKKILYLADPNSIHDIKWMSFFSGQPDFECFCVARHHHVKSKVATSELLAEKSITFLETITDYSVTRFWKNGRQARCIKKLIERHKIDIFHIMYAEPNALWALYRKFFNLPMLLTTRGTDVLKTIPQFLESRSVLSKIVFSKYKKSFVSFDHICGTSIRQAKSVFRMFGLNESVYQIIRTGVDIVEQESLPCPLEFQYIFFPRAMRPIYDHELALDALSKLPERYRTKYKFVFIGKDGKDLSYIKNFKAKVSNHPCRENILFLDGLTPPQMFQYYTHASLVVMTPISDGTPVSAMEAMLCRVPLLLPDLGYDEEIFANVNKYISGDASDLADIMSFMLDSSNSDQIEKNHEAVLQHGDRRKEMKKLERLYFQVSNASHKS